MRVNLRAHPTLSHGSTVSHTGNQHCLVGNLLLLPAHRVNVTCIANGARLHTAVPHLFLQPLVSLTLLHLLYLTENIISVDEAVLM